MKILEPGNTKKIEKLYGYLSQDENGNEGIVSSNLGRFSFQVPLMTSELEISEKFHKPEVEQMRKNTNTKIVFAEFVRVK